MNTNIPKKLRFYCRPFEKARISWEDFDEEEVEDVLPTFCCDMDNLKTNETAKSWAQNTKSSVFTTVEFENKSFSDIRILGLEHRSQGGRAYKVLVYGQYYFDLREDVLLDTILECGINKGGSLNGEFLFATINSQMKIIRANSKLHKYALENEKRKKLSKIPEKDLKEGYAYQTKSGKSEVFLGIAKVDNKKTMICANYYGEDYFSIFCKNSHSYVEEGEKTKLTLKKGLNEKIAEFEKALKFHNKNRYTSPSQLKCYEDAIDFWSKIKEENNL